jgi:hypothetical protein
MSSFAERRTAKLIMYIVAECFVILALVAALAAVLFITAVVFMVVRSQIKALGAGRRLASHGAEGHP